MRKILDSHRKSAQIETTIFEPLILKVTFKPKLLRGKLYQLDHLAPLTLGVIVGERRLALQVRFSVHCFTERLLPDDPPDVIYRHEGETRRFDLVRYELSKKLPHLINALPGSTIYRGKSLNFFFLRQLQETLRAGPYVVFFNLTKARHSKFDLLMRIESAYLKPNMTMRASPIRFETLIINYALGRDISFGPTQIIKRK